MNILIRRFDGEPYVWKRAKFVNGDIMVGDIRVYENNIAAVRNDNRDKYVWCSTCRTYFKKGSEDIEKHKAGCQDTSKCFDCQYMRPESVVTQSKKYQELGDGKYIIKTKAEAILKCRRSWESIEAQESRNTCIYNRCNDATMVDVKAFFLDYPNAFDTIATVDKIIDVGYKQAYYDKWEKCTYYILKGRNDIRVAVNELNIIDHILVYYRRTRYRLFYSKKYNKLFALDGGNSYKPWSSHDISKETQEYITNKIIALYA